LIRRAVQLHHWLAEPEVSVEDLLRQLRRAAAEAGATGEELEAVEMLLERVDARTEPLVASELRVRRMHLRFMRGLAFIDVGEMLDAVGLAAGDPTSPEYAIAMAELAHAELWAGEPGAPEHARIALTVARAAGAHRELHGGDLRRGRGCRLARP